MVKIVRPMVQVGAALAAAQVASSRTSSTKASEDRVKKRSPSSKSAHGSKRKQGQGSKGKKCEEEKQKKKEKEKEKVGSKKKLKKRERERESDSMSALEKKKQKLESEIEKQKSELARLSGLTDKNKGTGQEKSQDKTPQIMQAYTDAHGNIQRIGVMAMQPGAGSFVSVPGQQQVLYPNSNGVLPFAVYAGSPVSGDLSVSQPQGPQAWPGLARGYVGIPNPALTGQAPSFTPPAQKIKTERKPLTKKRSKEGASGQSTQASGGQVKDKEKKKTPTVEQEKVPPGTLVLKNLNTRPNALLVKISTNQRVSIKVSSPLRPLLGLE